LKNLAIAAGFNSENRDYYWKSLVSEECGFVEVWISRGFQETPEQLVKLNLAASLGFQRHRRNERADRRFFTSLRNAAASFAAFRRRGSSGFLRLRQSPGCRGMGGLVPSWLKIEESSAGSFQLFIAEKKTFALVEEKATSSGDRKPWD
jgi:hypothetical protein